MAGALVLILALFSLELFSMRRRPKRRQQRELCFEVLITFLISGQNQNPDTTQWREQSDGVHSNCA